jgi:hypothetical protein
VIPRGAPFAITGTSPAAPGLSVIGALAGLGRYDWFSVDAVLTQATGGVTDLCLQKKLATNLWLDWLRFPQLAAGTSVFNYSFLLSQATGGLVVCGTMPDIPAGTFGIAANSAVGGHPGDSLRLVAIAGTSTSAGAAQTVYVTPFQSLA